MTKSPHIESIINKEYPLLDHGFLRVVDYMGNDSSVVQAARVSYGDGTKQVNQDRGLIRYLMRHGHTTPFEMAEIKFHVKLPIFVARQWMRHRTGSFNECSARYSIMPNEFYSPSKEEMRQESFSNKQGSGRQLDPQQAERILETMNTHTAETFRIYEDLIAAGVSRERARILLPVSTYTEFYWKVNLNNLLHFLRLRADSHAQKEIRVYAEQIIAIVEAWVPHTAEAWRDFRLNAHTITDSNADLVKRMLQGEKGPNPNNPFWKTSEGKDFLELFGLGPDYGHDLPPDG